MDSTGGSEDYLLIREMQRGNRAAFERLAELRKLPLSIDFPIIVCCTAGASLSC